MFPHQRLIMKLNNGPKENLLSVLRVGYAFRNFIAAGFQLTKQGLLNCIRALGGYTANTSSKTIYTTDTFNEDDYLKSLSEGGGNTLIGLTL